MPFVAAPAQSLPRPDPLRPVHVRVRANARPSDRLALPDLERPAGYGFRAGQFLYVFVPGTDVKRAYSIASGPQEQGTLALCVKKVPHGPGSTYLYGLQPGDEVTVSRALGAFCVHPSDVDTLAFLATGTGVAPFRSMVRELVARDDPRKIWLLAGSRELVNLPYFDEFRDLAMRRGTFRYVPVLSGGPVDWDGDRGWIQEAFFKRFPHPESLDAYVCGVKRMVDDVRVLLRDKGLAKEDIHVERYV